MKKNKGYMIFVTRLKKSSIEDVEIQSAIGHQSTAEIQEKK